MKLFLILALSISSFSALAQFNELECEGKFQNKEIFFEVHQSFPGSTFKRATLTVTSERTENIFKYTVTSGRFTGFNRIQYFGSGVDLEVDLWPDTYPQWGRRYLSSLVSPDLGNHQISNIDCHFPNIR